MNKKRSALALAISLLTLSLLIATSYAAVELFGVRFYVAKGASETTEFQKGETVYLRAVPPIGGKTLDIKVDLIHPTRGTITLLSRTTVTISSETTILEAKYTIQEADPDGTYAMRVTAWDPITGDMRQADVAFSVKSPWPIDPAILAAVAVIVVAVIIAGAILLKGKPTVPTGAPAPVTGPTPGVETQVVQPGTIAIKGPAGETMTVTAWLQAGSKSIPISKLPQTFGREDFTGIVDPSALSTISRRHFSIGYDYALGTFVIWDENSTNGTYLNGVDIRGKGRQPLKDGDVISPSNVINIRFSSGKAT
ncbi:MAG: FHA domain-containing protein [Thermoproteota archaeon]